ncbi:MAG: class I SAM-dependent methyltransferase [bacterium]
MMRSLLSAQYRRIVSPSLRAKLWRIRRNLRELLLVAGSFARHLRFRRSGRCTVCLGKNLVTYTNQKVAQLPFRFYSCQDCGFIFVLAPTRRELGEVYEDHFIPDFGEGEKIWNDHYLRCINKFANGTGKLLEIGFGTGSFLKLAHEKGWNVYGVDLSEAQVERARKELKLPNLTFGTLEETAYPDNLFDVVAGFNFLEHVPDARKILKEIRRILRPSGVFAVMCPNIAGIYHNLMPEILAQNDPLDISWVPPQHLSYFNKNNLRLLLESAGFEEIEDASEPMSSLWLQFEPQIGPKATDQKLESLLEEIRRSSLPSGDARVAQYGQQIKRLIVERMTWTMLSDCMKLEPILGAEVGVLLLARNAAK